jgi:hypothetical protein
MKSFKLDYAFGMFTLNIYEDGRLKKLVPFTRDEVDLLRKAVSCDNDSKQPTPDECEIKLLRDRMAKMEKDITFISTRILNLYNILLQIVPKK